MIGRKNLVLAAVCAAFLSAPTTSAYGASTPERVAKTLVVRYEEGTTRADREAVRSEAGIRSAGMISSVSERVEVEGQRGALATAARLESDPRVRHAVPDYVARASQFVPNDPGQGGLGGWIDLQWNFLDPWGIRVLGAWDNAIASGKPGGQGVTVAVLDTGVAYRTSRGRLYRKAPDLDRKRFIRGHDFVRRSSFPYDRNGHGTFVTGTIAQQTNNGVGVTGVAYRARIMPVRVLDFEGKGDVASIARGIRFAARRGARIVNMSFEFDIGLTASQIPDVISAIRYAHRKGVLLIGAAGNVEDTRVAYPALANHVIGVGATTEHGCLAEYSNTGVGLDVVAPGGGADATIDGDPNCRTFEQQGRDVFQYTFSGSSFLRFGLPSGYEGTSMSVPHVTGTAALIIASGVLGPHPSPDMITARIQGTARDFGRPGYDSTYGWGLIDATAATAR